MGRPTREQTASTTIVTFRITATEREVLERIAATRKQSISDVLRALVQQEAQRLLDSEKSAAG
jgi:uncharacterized protein (DUF1778 family)